MSARGVLNGVLDARDNASSPTHRRVAELAARELVAEAEFDRALAIVRAQSTHLRDSGMSKASFALGVANALGTTFVIGRWPEHYWAYHGLKSVALLGVAYRHKFASRTQLHPQGLDRWSLSGARAQRRTRAFGSLAAYTELD